MTTEAGAKSTDAAEAAAEKEADEKEAAESGGKGKNKGGQAASESEENDDDDGEDDDDGDDDGGDTSGKKSGKGKKSSKVKDTDADDDGEGEDKDDKPKKVSVKDLIIPKNSQLGDEHVKGVVDFAKKHNLSPQAAQAMLDRDVKALTSYQAGQKEVLEEKVEEWKQDILDDKELGGDNTKETSILVKKVVDRFGSKSLKKALNETGLGNHPELVRFVHSIGKSMTSDQLVIPEGGNNNSGGKKSAAEVLYGGSEKKNE